MADGRQRRLLREQNRFLSLADERFVVTYILTKSVYKMTLFGPPAFMFCLRYLHVIYDLFIYLTDITNNMIKHKVLNVLVSEDDIGQNTAIDMWPDEK